MRLSLLRSCEVKGDSALLTKDYFYNVVSGMSLPYLKYGGLGYGLKRSKTLDFDRKVVEDALPSIVNNNFSSVKRPPDNTSLESLLRIYLVPDLSSTRFSNKPLKPSFPKEVAKLGLTSRVIGSLGCHSLLFSDRVYLLRSSSSDSGLALLSPASSQYFTIEDTVSINELENAYDSFINRFSDSLKGFLEADALLLNGGEKTVSFSVSKHSNNIYTIGIHSEPFIINWRGKQYFFKAFDVSYDVKIDGSRFRFLGEPAMDSVGYEHPFVAATNNTLGRSNICFRTNVVGGRSRWDAHGIIFGKWFVYDGNAMKALRMLGAPARETILNLHHGLDGGAPHGYRKLSSFTPLEKPTLRWSVYEAKN